MDLSLVFKNLQQLKSTDLTSQSVEEIKSSIVSANQLVGNDLPHYVVPHSFHGLPLVSGSEHLPQIYAIAGIGIMSIIDQIKLHSSDNIIIYEPTPGLAYMFLSQIDISIFFGNSNVHIFTNMKDFANGLQNIYEWWTTVKAWKTPSCERLHPDKVQAFHQCLNEKVVVGKANLNTINKTYFWRARNELVNLHAFKNRGNAISCPGGMKNIPAILVGAGPSLRTSLPVLKDASKNDNVLIIAASTTLRVLIPEGIYPHFVIIIEGEKQTHFENIPNLDQLRLVAHLQTSPGHLEYPFKDIFWFTQKTSPIVPVVSSIHQRIQPVKFSGCVLSAAFLLARFWGCNPIAFTGMDLAYRSGDKYMKGLEKRDEEHDQKPFYDVPSQDGRLLIAPPEFLSYAQTIETELEHLKKTNPEFQAVNASVGGRRIKGMVEMGLDKFVNQFTSHDLSVNRILTQVISTWPVLPTDAVDAILRNHLKIYQKLAVILDTTPSSLQSPESLKSINELLNKLPVFNSDTVRLIAWVRHIRSGRDVSDADLLSLKTEVCQILDELS